MSTIGRPEVATGRVIFLPDRGETWVREASGPAGAPTVLLLHGLGATAALNWYAVFEILSRRYRVIALDQRGHGHGIRSPRRFQLAEACESVAARAFAPRGGGVAWDAA